jgi:L-histidine N-alpha-methyltransferase
MNFGDNPFLYMNSIFTQQSISKRSTQFFNDIITGLRQVPKKLPSKYFYDTKGDKLFQDIMNSPEYYLTDCELEIFTNQSQRMVDLISNCDEAFDLIELGPGDGLKSFHLLLKLTQNKKKFTYVPIDISENIVRFLEETLPAELPGLRVNGLKGDYFDMLNKATAISANRKIILCLGGNIGNMPKEEAILFSNELHSHLATGDMVIFGFDLVKNPNVIQAAYNDGAGITSRFNLNLLERINRELDADFDLNLFEHFCTYDPESGACKSYLVSLADMDIHIQGETVSFKRDEFIWMEISQKYTISQINEIAYSSGFFPLNNLLDSKNWFADSIWFRM